jgi:hypothetical protein
MRHQLEFWPAAETAPDTHKPWESLGIDEQAERIALLARLIAMAIRPHREDEMQENSHEQQREDQTDSLGS